jgi:hypothetical protein
MFLVCVGLILPLCVCVCVCVCESGLWESLAGRWRHKQVLRILADWDVHHMVMSLVTSQQYDLRLHSVTSSPYTQTACQTAIFLCCVCLFNCVLSWTGWVTLSSSFIENDEWERAQWRRSWPVLVCCSGCYFYLFICSLFYDAFSVTKVCSVQILLLN